MKQKCNYCGNKKESHENNHVKTTRHHVKVRGDATSRTYGKCDKKARNDEKYEL